MRILLLLLLCPFIAPAQSYMLTNAGDTLKFYQFKGSQYAYEWLRKDWPLVPQDQSLVIDFLHGDGEEGTGLADSAKLKGNGPMKQLLNGYRPPSIPGKVTVTAVLSPQRSPSFNFWDESDQTAIITMFNRLKASPNKRINSGYSGGGAGTYFFGFAHPENWAAIHVTAGAYGSQGSYVEDKYAIKSIPGVKLSHSTTDASQAISNSFEALDSTLSINALNPYLVETDFYYGLSHTIIDDTVYNKFDQYVRWYMLHDRRFDTMASLHVDSLDRGFDDHFYRKTRRLVDSMATSPLKTTFQARVAAAAERAYGVGWAEYGVTTGPAATDWKALATNAVQTVTGLIDNRSRTVSGITFSIVSTGGSTQKRTYTNNYNQYNGLPAGALTRPNEIFSKTATTTYRYGALPNGIYYVVIDGTSETTPGSFETGLSTTVNGVTKTMRLQWRNTNKYLIFGPVTVTGGTLDIASQGYVASGVGHIGAMRLIKTGTYGGANQPPNANAGGDQTKTLPTTTATLVGTATDLDGAIAASAWTKVSGPIGGTITSPASLTTGITALQQGTYIYRLTVTDDDGDTDTDEMNITVDASIKGTAGADYWIPMQQGRPQLPFTVTFTDTMGVSTSWAWTKLSGSGTLSNATQRTATLSGIALGATTLRVVATASGGVTVSDTITITLRDLMNRGRELPCRSGTKQTFKVGGTIGGGINTVSFSMQYVKRDNLIPGLMGGDTIMLLRNPNNGGIWNRVTFGDIEAPAGCPIVIVPDSSGSGIVVLSDTATNNTSAFYIASHDSNVVKNVIVDGTRNYTKKGVAYGFEIGNPGVNNTHYYYRGVTGNYLNGLTLKGIALFNCSTGFSLKTISDSTKPFKVYDHFRNTIYIEDCYADSAINEIAYIGTTDPPGLGQGNDGPAPKGTFVSFNRMITRGSGWDALQVSFYGSCSIKNSVVLRSGTANSPGQIFAAFPGGKVGPAIMDSNFFRYAVGGPGFLGEGKSSFRNNIVWDYQQMYNSQAVVTGIQETYDSLQIFIENNYFIGQTGSSFGVITTNTGGEKFKPGSFRGNTILTNKTLSTFYSTSYGDTIAGNAILAPSINPNILLDTSRLANMPAYLMYKYIAANPSNRKPSFFDIYAPVAPPEPNLPPVANAGSDVSSSATSVNLIGSATDADGTLIVAWSQTSGTTATITGGTTLTPTISGLTVGTRIFRLRATDNDGAVTDDFVTVTTTANQPPVITSITASKTISTTTLDLTVTATDPEGGALTYLWFCPNFTPVEPSMSNVDQPNAQATGLLPGDYDFAIQVSDNAGNATIQFVNITVRAATVPALKFRLKGKFLRKL